MAKKRLGDILIERGLIDSDQLTSALGYQRQWGHRLGTALVAKGFLAEGTLTRVLAESLRLPMVDLSKVGVEPEALKVLLAEFCERKDVLPISVREHRGRRMLLLAMADPLDVNLIDEIAFITGLHIRPAIAQISSLQAAVQRHYRGHPVDIPPLNFEIKARVEDSFTIVNGTGDEFTVDGKNAPQRVGTGDILPWEDASQDDVAGHFDQKTGVYMVKEMQESAASDGIESAGSIERDQLESLEKKFWALMRLLAGRGIVTKEDFLRELSRNQ